MKARTSVRDVFYTAREALADAGSRRAALQDVGGPAACVGDERHLDAAIDWLCRAQDACAEGGVSYGYHVRHGWMAAYPETTGYIIPTLFDCAQRTGKVDACGHHLRDRAIGLARWLTRVQLDSGAIPGGTVLLFPQPTVFNTGQVLDGWCRTLQETGAPEIRDAIRRAAAWLVSVLDDDGCWRRGLSPLTPKTPAVYNVRTASMLLRSGILLGDAAWRDAAIRNANWALTQQNPNGWFNNNCVADNVHPLTHTIGYTLEGLLNFAIQLGDERHLAAVMRTSDALLPRIRADGFIAGRFDAQWRPATTWNCLTGASQLAMVWFRLSRVTGDEKYASAARRVLDFVKGTQRIGSRSLSEAGCVGGIKGSHPIWGHYEPFAYPNWATKFFADALIEALACGEPEASADSTAGAVPVRSLNVGYVVEDYPTFIVSEISQLRRLGAEVTVFSAFRPQPEADPVKESVRRESIYLPRSLVRTFRENVRFALRHPLRYASACTRLMRERESLRFLLLGACHAAVVERRCIHHVHGTFGTRTTTLAYVIARLAGIEYSFTTHAYDVFRPNPSLVWKTNAAAFMRTISRFNRAFIEQKYPGVDASRIRVVYLGVDADALRPRRTNRAPGPTRIVSIGSLIEQKGHFVLVRSCARLMEQRIPFECRIIGEGPLRSRLEDEIRRHGLEAHVRLTGARPHAEALRELERADIFTLPCIDMRGRGEHIDGIPLVLMEAMAAGLPVVSTKLSGIPELIASGTTGMLVAPEDPVELAAALASLANNPAVRRTLGAAAREAVVDRFDLIRNTLALAREMRRA
jgi:glycosyltransferase involved in cell wall biosynthesis